MKQYIEIAIAGCLGALAGLALALVLEWSILLSIPIGMIVGFVGYRPFEIRSTAREFGRDVSQAVTIIVERMKQDKTIENTVRFCKVISLIVVAVGSLLVIPVILWCNGIVYDPKEEGHDVPMLPMFGLVLAFLGVIACVLLACTEMLPVRWAMPLSQRLYDAWLTCKPYAGKVLDFRWLSKEGMPRYLGWVLICLTFPVIFQCLIILWPVLILDALVTLFFACASTERLASVLGAMLGCMAGCVCVLLGLSFAPAVILSVGGIVGWCSGPLVYHLRKKIEATQPVLIAADDAGDY